MFRAVNDALAAKLLAPIGALFVLGALAILGGRLFGAGREAARKVWAVYWLEFAVIASVIGPAYLGRWGVLGLAIVLVILCTRELCRAFGFAGVAISSAPLIALGVGLAIVAAVAEPLSLFAALVVSTMAVLALSLLGAAPSGFGPRAGAALLALAFPILGATMLVLLSRRADGFAHISFLFAIVETNDAAAYLFGSFFGRRKLWPRLSPRKTLGGSLAGLAGGVGAALLFGFAVPQLRVPHLVFIGVLVGVVGQVGDLVASAWKRDAQQKEYASVLPGVGGFLDQFDAFLFVTPFYWAATIATDAMM